MEGPSSPRHPHTVTIPEPMSYRPKYTSDFLAMALANEAKIKPEAQSEPSVPTCTWTPDEDGTWWTDCGEGYQFFDGGPTENGFKFCPYCGKALDTPTP